MRNTGSSPVRLIMLTHEIPEKQSCVKYTQDEWYGNEVLRRREDGKSTRIVTVSFFELRRTKKEPQLWRVCVWGNDDFGLEIDLEDRGQAMVLYRTILRWEFVNKQPLKDLGFYNA